MKIKLFTLFIIMVFAAGCTHPKREQKGLPATLEKTDACFILYDLNNEKMVKVINEERCKERFPACSTFKLPLAVMAFDDGIFTSSNSRPYKWDGTQHMIPAWNKEHSAKSWMQDSVVWYSQRLTREMGRKKVQKYLDKFGYGNEDFSGGVEDAWLTTAPFLKEPPKTTVQISAFEQIEFLKKLYQFKLPVSMNAMSQAQGLLTTEVSSKGSVLSGKTGSGFIGEGSKQRLGWFVGYLKSGVDEYLTVMTFSDLEPQENPGFGGALAKESMKQLLLERGLW